MLSSSSTSFNIASHSSSPTSDATTEGSKADPSGNDASSDAWAVCSMSWWKKTSESMASLDLKDLLSSSVGASASSIGTAFAGSTSSQAKSGSASSPSKWPASMPLFPVLELLLAVVLEAGVAHHDHENHGDE